MKRPSEVNRTRTICIRIQNLRSRRSDFILQEKSEDDLMSATKPTNQNYGIIIQDISAADKPAGML